MFRSFSSAALGFLALGVVPTDPHSSCLALPASYAPPTDPLPDTVMRRYIGDQGIDLLARLPKVVDYRLATSVVTPVKDQGQCGSCWAFSSAESIEGQLGLNGHLANVSAQNFVDCVRLDAGCGGGWMDDALAYAEAHGVETESDYPYHAITQTCQADPARATIRPTAYVNVAKTNHALKVALITFGPLSIALDASGEFMEYSNTSAKVFTDDTCDPEMPDHALLLAGYNDAEGYWIVKNSWNTGWGREGYIYMNNTVSNMCGIASYATVPYIAPANAAEEKARVCAHLAAVPEWEKAATLCA